MLPQTVTGNLAAVILGHKPHTVARLAEQGLLVDVGRGHWRRITTESIREFRGYPVTIAEYGEAKATLNDRYIKRELRRHGPAA